MMKSPVARLSAIAACVMFFGEGVLAQGLKIEIRAKGKEQHVVAVLTPAQLVSLGKKAGLESDLTSTSRALSERELSGEDPVLLGPHKSGLHVVTVRGEKATYTELLLLEQPKDGAPLVDVLAAATPKVDPKTAGAWRKYWGALDGDVLKAVAKRSAQPVVTKVALKAPVLLIACGAAVELPPLLAVCTAQGKDLAIDVAAEVIKQSITELEQRKVLTADEAKLMRAQVAGTQGLVAVISGPKMFDRVVGAGFGAAEVGMELLDASEQVKLTGAIAKEQTTKYKVLIDVVKANK
jgi:hypothetical protein